MSQTLRIGIIGGSGLGERLREGIDASSLDERVIETPFGSPSGSILTGRFGEVPVALLQRHGEGHVHNPSTVPYRANIFALKRLGCTHIIASGATGSLREHIEPGHIVLVDQIIDKTCKRPNTFYERAAVHVEFADPCCDVMREWLLNAAHRDAQDVMVHERGTYICMEGPAFSTRAESEMHRQWGGDLIGMTAMPEARLTREAEMAYALIALPTDYDCWRPREPDADDRSLIEEIIGNLNRATDASLRLIRAALADTSILRERASSAHDALRLAIWSHKSAIDAGEVERLSDLWGRYFDQV